MSQVTYPLAAEAVLPDDGFSPRRAYGRHFTADPLLRHLVDSSLARPDPPRLGLDTDASAALRDAGGRPASDLVTVALPLRGRWYETTAHPGDPRPGSRLAG